MWICHVAAVTKSIAATASVAEAEPIPAAAPDTMIRTIKADFDRSEIHHQDRVAACILSRLAGIMGNIGI
jgi:hypothetical protein